MKGKHLVLLIVLILLADQALKIYIKTNYYIGEEHRVLGSWFRLHFVENEGMAWGWKFGGGIGKILLTLFRLVAVVIGTFYLRKFIAQKYHKGFIICAGLIYAGALGNLIDSMFYGLIFENSDPFMQNVAKIFPAGGGYTSFLHGKVVDMLYFPLITNAHYPQWFPFWAGEEFEFFRPVFNLADASISAGVIAILIWQQKFFPQSKDKIAKEKEAGTPVE
ncbi:lipoprotein signal peptidase [Filimonas effusa]|uniref:Lipoprotein signal peptidase n=1 Tax=Filimonas effusa TaxID=2508721 RepID=A0A4Q1D488_9BACT|nr:lipoprotein signal peptidase [Filimonas effusa]RXK83245.1 lipoprotein signal peptidase [Filimonas effusa]